MFWYGFMLGVVASIFTIILNPVLNYLISRKEGETFSNMMFKAIAPYWIANKEILEESIKEIHKDDNE